MSKWLNQIIAADETQQFLAKSGTQPFPVSPECLARYQREQAERWAALVKAAGIEPQ